MKMLKTEEDSTVTMTERTPRVGNVVAVIGTPVPQQTAADSHPVEVVGRIREHPDGRGQPSAIHALSDGKHLRIMSKENQSGYKVFSLDGVSRAENESLQVFYRKYAEARVDDVKVGGKCTIVMYGPTGAGKSHTMFGSGTERGVAYHALTQIMGEGREQEVIAKVWEIFNEDIYDLLAQTTNPTGSMKGPTNRVKLEVKSKKVRNSTSISERDCNRLLREIQKVEKRRVTKSTNCNERSSRSHCIVSLEVPEVDGRLVLVDMAGSENIEQAGMGMESKMQTGKINQGNGALKRVVEAIANGENHIPYRDSKLTMILQESFEDKNAKMLMILCASPDPKDLYKTQATFEYGAKAKRIVRLPNSPAREKAAEEEHQKLAVVNAIDIAKDACILKLRRDKERSDRAREVTETEVTNLRKRVDEMESQMSTTRNESEQSRRRLEQLEQVVEDKQREVEYQRMRAERAETEVQKLKKVSFSNLENDPQSAGVVTTLAIEPAKQSAVEGSKGNSSTASAKEKKEKKFSSSMLSFFKGSSDSAHSSKKSTHGKLEGTLKDSPHQQIASPRSEKKSFKKRQAGQEAPSPKTAEKKRHMGQDVALTAITWQPSTLQQLLSVKEEEKVTQDEDEKSSTPDIAHQFKNLSSPYSRPNSPAWSVPNSPVKTESSAMDASPAVEIDCEDDLNLQRREILLGLPGAWSESKLRRKGWLPIIAEEQEDDGQGGEKVPRRSLEASAQRTSASCPRLRDASHFHDVDQTRSSGASLIVNELTDRNLSMNLLRDKFSPGIANEEKSDFLKRLDSEASLEIRNSGNVMENIGEVDSLRPGIEIFNNTSTAGSPVDYFLQRASPSLNEATWLEVTPLATRQPSSDPSPVFVEAESARKARIENIFLLCGHRREIEARAGGESPQPRVLARSQRENLLRGESPGNFSLITDAISPYSKSLSFRDRDIQSEHSLELDAYCSPAKSPSRSAASPEVTLLSSSSLLPVLPSPQKSESPSRHPKFRTGNLFPSSNQTPKLPGFPEGAIRPSPRSVPPTYSTVHYGNENVDPSTRDGDEVGLCDVYVKWESKDTTGKFICMLKLPRSATLSDLREEILSYVAAPKENFMFLMLGDAGGVPVEKNLEPALRVLSLPECPGSMGSRLASLRPPVTHTAYVPPSRPFRPIENQISHSVPEHAGNGAKVVTLKPSSLSKGLGTLASGVPEFRGGSGLKEKASAAYVKEAASKLVI